MFFKEKFKLNEFEQSRKNRNRCSALMKSPSRGIELCFVRNQSQVPKA